MDRFKAVQAFAKVVELGSFARAAERLGTSTSAVSRLLADLEAHLDARLVHRTTRRLSLTEAGQSFYERSVQLLNDLEEAEGSVRATGVSPKGTLRLTCGVSFGERFLAPAISEFAARHRGQHEFTRPLQAQVLQRVHREIHAAFGQRMVEFGSEELLAIDLRQRLVEHAVAARFDAHQFHLETRMGRAQRGGHLAALHPGQCGSSRPQTQCLVAHKE